MDCAERGVHLAVVPLAERGAAFTALFEALVIDWLHEASKSVVARRLGPGWKVIDGIMGRAVKRGMARRDEGVIRSRIGVDETSFRKCHDYVTMVTDTDWGCVVNVADDLRKESSPSSMTASRPSSSRGSRA